MSLDNFSTSESARCSAGSKVLSSFLRAKIALLCSFHVLNFSCNSSSVLISTCSSSSIPLCSFLMSCSFLDTHARCVPCKLSIVAFIFSLAVCIASIFKVSSFCFIARNGSVYVFSATMCLNIS